MVVARSAAGPSTATAAELPLQPEVAPNAPADFSTSKAPEQPSVQPDNLTRTGEGLPDPGPTHPLHGELTCNAFTD